MRNTSIHRAAAALLLLIGLQQGANAQASGTSLYTVRVTGLTSAERDAMALDLDKEGDVRLVFACVPAGLLVFEPMPNQDRNAARTRATAVLEARTQRNRVSEVPMDIADAEAACAEARNQWDR